MDQLPELRNYKLILEGRINTTWFNFTDAEDILVDFESNLYTLNSFSTVLLLSLYVPIFLLGLISNILIILSVNAEKARKSNLYFLVNLAQADLAVTVLCIPTSIGTIVYKLWVYRRFPCKFTAFIQDAEDNLVDFESNLFTLNSFSTVVLLSLYVPIFLLGLIGNILIILSVSAEKARKSNIYFLVNLALADLAVTVLCIPTSIGTIVHKLWVYGRFLCKSTAFIQGVAVAVSIFSMTAMAVDRYISLQHPAVSQRFTSCSQSFAIIIFMWVVAGCFMGPLLYIRDIDVLDDVPFMRPLPFCIENWPQDRDRQAYAVFLMFVVFIIPAFTICVCYGNVGKALCYTERHQRFNSDGSTQRLVSRQRAARMVIILICVFMISWLPYNIISALSDMSENPTITHALPYVLWFGHAHSAFNPMLYWSLNRHFRQSIHRLVNVVKISGCSGASTQTVSLPHFV